jgi:hypothetical protein
MMKLYGLGLVATVGCFSAFSATASAETVPARADVSCLQTPAKLDDSALQSFMTDPAALLTSNPAGGLPLSNQVRGLAGSSSLAFNKIMELTKTATDSQKSAIAAGLARVVYVCGTVGTEATQDYAAAIQTSVAGFGDPAFASTFQKSSEDVNVASVGPGAGGTAIGGGATATDETQQGASNNYKSPGDGPRDTTSSEYTVGTAGEVISPGG